MSYARFGEDSDVYIYKSTDKDGNDVWVCDEVSRVYEFKTIPELLKHLEEHIKNGDKVPGYCFQELLDELENEALP